MSALSDLLRDIRHGSTLAWSLAWAPDGEQDVAAHKAWWSETVPGVLRDAACMSRSPTAGELTVVVGAHARPGCMCPTRDGDEQPNRMECERIRRSTGRPTFATMTRGLL